MTLQLQSTTAAPSAEVHRLIPGMVGTSPPMQRLAAMLQRCAQLRSPVMLLGESGTGKELAAQAVHRLGGARNAPFIALNAAALPAELAASELFGHARGAFTGAAQQRDGAFRRADGGTLFIDELGALPGTVQPQLLRAVEDGEIAPIGSDRRYRVRVRIITATCEPLRRMVQERLFRADLYQRLAVCMVALPPLRQRTADIPALVRHMLRDPELSGYQVSPAAIDTLRRHSWPGNVRELRNALIQATLHSRDTTIGATHLDRVFGGIDRRQRSPLGHTEALRLLAEAKGNISEAARAAQIPRSTFRDLLGRARPKPLTLRQDEC